jgi:hypothetical protein
VVVTDRLREGDGSDEGDGGDEGLSFLPTHALERLCSLFPFPIPFALSLSKRSSGFKSPSMNSGRTDQKRARANHIPFLTSITFITFITLITPPSSLTTSRAPLHTINL